MDKCKILCCADCEEKKYCRKVECRRKLAFNPKNCEFYPISYEQYMAIFDSLTKEGYDKFNDKVFNQVDKNKGLIQ